MAFEIWLAFVASSMALVLIPEPTVLLVVSFALGQGWRVALPMAVGVALGDFTAMSLSFGHRRSSHGVSNAVYSSEMAWRGLSDLSRHQAFPRWWDTQRWAQDRRVERAPHGRAHIALWPQVLTLQATFLIMAFANTLAYAYFASRARGLVRSEWVIGAVYKTGGAMLIGAGVASVAIRTGK